MTTATVQRVCDKLKDTLLQFSRSLENSPFTVAHPDEVTFTGGQIKLNSDPTQALSGKRVRDLPITLDKLL